MTINILKAFASLIPNKLALHSKLVQEALFAKQIIFGMAET